MQNGLLLKWKVRYKGDLLNIGSLNINSINKLNRVDISTATFISNTASNSAPSNLSLAFDLDSLCIDGRVVLVCESDLSKSRIYFQDLSCRYYFLCNTFTEYVRLLFLHLGLPRWQYAFTDCGLPPTTIQWMRLFANHRLQLDVRSSRNLRLCSEEGNAASTVDITKKKPVIADINFDKIEKNAKIIRGRAASKKKHKKSTPDLLSAASEASRSLQQRLRRPGSAPGKTSSNSVSGLMNQPKFASVSRPETASGNRRSTRGSFNNVS
uniref:Knr4/Smi1-like domain-containing protein n=1 Tax=Spongospora subterranea TaxID=70186 RepID=A0A0H5QWB4_9EUKA|eukprot:CRZ06047.1 hypothetical protein [Spongospora subterranea]